MALSYVTITASVADGSNTALTGTITFTPSETLFASGIPIITPANPVEAQIVGGQLQSSSGGTLQLLATDNSGITLQGRTGFWFWTVAISITSGGATTTDGWDFYLPSSPSSVDLYSLANTGSLVFANPMTGVGQVIYGGTNGAPEALNGNTTTTREFLRQVGDGTNSAAPAWDTISPEDVLGGHVDVITSGDALQLTGCTLTSGSTTATFNGASLTSADQGKAVVAVHGTDYLVTTISTVASSTSATLAAAWPGATTTGAEITYGTDQAASINAALTAIGNLGGGRVMIASPVLCLSTLSVPDNTGITALGFSLAAAIYAGHYNNVVQSSLWGVPSTSQNQFCDACDLTIIALLPVTALSLGQADSSGSSQYLFTTVQLPAGTLSEVFTSGAFPVSSSLDSRWPAGSAGSPVYFWHNDVCFYYTSATPFATTSIADPSVSSATILTHGYVYPLDSQGHGVAFQSFRGKIARVRAVGTLGSGIRVQGSGTADPTCYGHRIEWIRAESPGWAGAEMGESTTDDFLDILSCTSPGVAGLVVMGGDPTVRTVHAVGQATRPWVPHLVACPTNGSYRDLILDTCYGPGFVLDGGLQYRGVGPSETRLDGLRYLGSDGKPGHGIPILAKTRASSILIEQLGISGVTFSQDCAALFAHGPQTEMANGANVVLSTTAADLPVLDATGFDAMGGQTSTSNGTSTRTTTYTGVTINTTLTSGSSQSVTIGSGGTLTLAAAFPATPASGDWYILGGVAAVEVDPSNTGGTSLVYTTAVSLHGATGTITIAGGSFASYQALTGCTLASGTQTMATGGLVVGTQLQQGTVQGSLSAPGATGMSLPSAQPPVLVKSTDSLLITPDSQVGSDTGPPPVTVTASYSIGGSDSTIICNGTGITITLPTAAGIAGRPYTIINAATSPVTVSPQSGEAISGAPGYVIPASPGNNVTVESDGANWQVKGALYSPGRIILVSQYAPAALTGKSVSTTTLSAFDSATLTTGTFTVPPSGVIMVTVSALVTTPTANNVYSFAVAAHGTVSPVLGNVISAEMSSGNNKLPHVLEFYITGLTAGTALALDLLGAIAANTLTIEAIGTQSTTPTANAGAPVTFTVREAA